jgi:beta-lactamase regulating signal transducer with metallopeptidase domain
MTIVPDILMRAVCWTLLHSLWQGLIFAMVAGIILVLTKRSPSALRYNLLCSGMVLFLAVSGYTFYRQLPVGGGLAGVQPEMHAGVPSIGNSKDPLSNLVTAPEQPASIRTAIDALVQYFNSHAALVVVIWFILFLARFVKLLSGWVYAQRIRYYQTSPVPAEWQQRLNALLAQLRISRPVALLESALIAVPIVVGALKPVILVPMGLLTQLPAHQVESILLHELAHIRRRDYLFNLVQHVVDTLFFFNPALVWVSSLIRTERENCCDDIAIRETRSRRQLIEALVAFHEYRQRSGGIAVAFAGKKESQVVRRVKRIVHKTNESLNVGQRVVLMGSLLIVCAAFITIRSSSRPAVVMAHKKTGIVTVATKPALVPVIRPAAGATNGTAAMERVTKPAAERITGTAERVTEAATVQAPGHTAEGVTRFTAEQSDTTRPGGKNDSGEGLSYLGYHNLSLDKLIELKEHGVTADFILSFRQMGYPELSPDQAIRLKDHGVSVEYIRSLMDMGYKPLSLGEATELRDHGVSSEFIHQLNQLGFTHISLEKARDLVDHGVTAEYIIGCKKRFGKLFELNDYIKLRDAGINPAE